MFLSESLFNKYCIRNPELIKLEQRLRKDFKYYKKKI